MKIRLLLFALLCTLSLEASLEKFFCKIENKGEISPIRKIDFIYLINLDQRPEKFAQCMMQLKPYGIFPHRVSAINGWALSPETLDAIGLPFAKGMEGERWAKYFPLEKGGDFQWEFLTDASVGKAVVAPWTTQGAIGCTLSHLSVLQDAYDAGYETIWVMEDDIYVLGNPYHLTELIERLDTLVGRDGWDLFYTDLDIADKWMYPWENDFETDLKGDLWWFWRPDGATSEKIPAFIKRTIVSDDFIRIGSRFRTHSMILRRSGIKKILDHYHAHPLFIPHDHELAYVPNLQMYSLRYPLITHRLAPSDTIARP